MADWTWAAASRPGTAHERGGEDRQDAYRVVADDGAGLLAVVVCDGAGSASAGGHGARIAAWTLGEHARSWLSHASRVPEDDTAVSWMLSARDRIRAAAARRSLDPADFATTAVLVLSDGRSTLTAHVGDGAVTVRTLGPDACWKALSWPEHGEHAGTTRFLTDAGGPSIRAHRLDVPVDCVAVMTDGLERLALDFRLGTPHAPFLDPMTAALRRGPARGRDADLCAALAAYLDGDAVNERTDDDKTLVIAACG